MNTFIVLLIFLTGAHSALLHFETTCNAHQFIHLENLIGSLHSNGPRDTILFVRDKGLTDGQLLLLKQYENVRIISAKDLISNQTQLIAVDKELIFVNDRYEIRLNRNKHIFIDFIRKQYRLAVVIPFIQSQFTKLIKQLNLSQIYKPCRTLLPSVDLIFYHDVNEQSLLKKEIENLDSIRRCYQNIRYLSINFTKQDNWYPYGSFLMWQKLFLHDHNNHLSLRSYGYTHLFLMEPDTRPIRNYWLDHIVQQITKGQNPKQYLITDWWVLGSVYRGSQEIGERFLHINGNALYHLSANFIDFIQTFSDYYRNGDNRQSGYDLIMYNLLLKNINLGKRYLHRFQFSDFIQNCWHTGCEGSEHLNNTQFIRNNPNTYLVHGNYVPDIEIQPSTSEPTPPTEIYIIICISVACFVFVLSRSRTLLNLRRLPRICCQQRIYF